MCVCLCLHTHSVAPVNLWSSLSHVRLWDPMDYSLPCSSIRGILQARILERVAISFSRRSSQPRDRTWVSRIVGRLFTIWATREAQSCPTLCDPLDGNPPGSSVHGISQARILGRVAISFSRVSSWSRGWIFIFYMSCLGRQILYHLKWSEMKWSEVAQLCPTVCDCMDCSLPDSSVRGIFQARILEWVVISLSRGTSRPRDRTWVSRIVGRGLTGWATREAPLSHL